MIILSRATPLLILFFPILYWLDQIRTFFLALLVSDAAPACHQALVKHVCVLSTATLSIKQCILEFNSSTAKVGTQLANTLALLPDQNVNNF
jgi:hypothetical protein